MHELMNVSEIELTYKSKVKPSDRKKVTSSKNAADLFRAVYEYGGKIEYKELFYAMYLNRNNRVLGVLLISEGGLSGTVVDAKIVFQGALKLNASAVILCHNHPSGNLKPSQADTDITRKIKEGGKLLDIDILDHIILTSESYYSFADEGIF